MKKIISFVLAFTLIGNLILTIPAEAAEAAEPIIIKNGTVEYRVNKQNGRFTVHTQDGIPDKASDNDKNLLFLGKDKLPNTSFTTFKINGEDYIFGNSYGLMGKEGGIVGETVVGGKQTRTVWKIGDVTVTQKLFLIVDESNPNIGNTKITYEISNAGSTPVEIGSRILLDTQLGINDASAMVVGTQYLTNEKVYEGENVPVFWKSSEKQFAPDVVSYGILSGFGNTVPSKFAIGHWESLRKTKWDFEPDEKINFTTNKNTYGSADSGTAVYFEPRTLENGKDLVFETFYGIGSTSDTYSDVALGVQLNSPLKLTVNEEGTAYKEQEFDVVVNLDNNIEGGETLHNVAVTIGTSSELSLAGGTVATQFIDQLQFGETANAKFRIKAKPCEKLAVAEYGITVTYDGGMAESSKYIILPSIKGTPPKMQMNEISPKILYTKANKKKVVIKGSDFASLKADLEWTMEIKSPFKTYDIKRKDVQIEDDTLTINIDSAYEFDKGEHEIVINSSTYGKLSKKIELSDDPKFDRKEYGIMLIGAFDPPEAGKSRDKYSVKLLASEEEIDALPEDTQEKILLTMKGEIYSYVIEGIQYYDCDPGTIINNAIKYTPPVDKPKQAMTIRRYEGINTGVPKFGMVTDALILSGTGTLAIADYSFHSGDFYIKLEDKNDYELTEPYEPKPSLLSEEGGENVEIITPTNEIINGAFSGVSVLLGLNIQVSNAVIGTNTVSLGGSVIMDTPWWAGGDDEEDEEDEDDDKELTKEQKDVKEKFDKNEKIEGGFGAGKQDESILKLNMEEMRYGINNNSSVLVGLKADGGLNITDDSIPMLKAGGAKLGFALNSLDYPGMYAAVNGGFKIGDAFEAEAAIAVIIETNGDSYLDSIELVMGGKVMKIPLGGLGFLTKLGGGISGLYDTTKGNFTYIPPIMLKLISGYADPTMFSFQLDTIGAEFGPRGFQFTAEDGKIVGIKLIESAYAKFLMYENDDKDLCVDLGAGMKMNFLGLIRGEGSAWLIYDPQIDGIFGPVSLGGKVFVGVFLPDWIPLVGGLELLSVMAELSTKRVFLGVRVIGIPISVGYYWDSGEVKFFDTFAATVDGNGNYVIPPEEFENALCIDYSTENGVNSAVVYGGNLRKTYSSTDSSKARRSLLSETEALTHTVPVYDQAYGLFEFTCEGETPEIKITQPNGEKYALEEGVNYMTQIIPRDKTESGVEEKKVFISVENPQNGDWVIKTSKPVDCNAMDVLPLPEIKEVKQEQLANNKIKVNWEALNVDEDYTVDIHASKAQDPEAAFLSEKMTPENADEINKAMADNYDAGIRIAQDINANDKSAVIDLGDRLLDGDYQIRVVLKKGDENFASVLSEEKFTYNNPKTPKTPENVKVGLGGDGLFKVSYDPVEGASGYYVEVLDENGNMLEGVAPVSTKETQTYIGGTYSVADTYDENNNPLTYKAVGVKTGSKYKVRVSAFNEMNAMKYESTAYISEAMMLPEPDPAKINIKIDDVETSQVDTVNENNKNGLVNTNNPSITLTPNQDVELVYMVNQVYPTYEVQQIKANEPFAMDLDLNDGENHISIFAKNAANDYTNTNVTINVDTIKPELMINNTTVMSVDGNYEIVGTSENNSVVYINDAITAIEQVDGVFTYKDTQRKTRDQVKITAVDTAGNENTVYIDVIPSELSSFKKMVVKEETKNGYETITKEKIVKKGDQLNLAMFGVDPNGKEYQIDHSEVHYSIIFGDGVCRISENGLVEAQYPGDAIVLCEYYPTESYSFEEVVAIKVEDVFTQAEDIRISTDELLGATEVGSEVARFSVPSAPLGISYNYSIKENDYFEIADNQLVLKKAIDFDNFDIEVTAMGKHIIDGAYEEIGKPVTKTFTLKTVKAVLSMETLDPVNAFIKTDFESAGLPSTIKVTLDTGEQVECDVSWQTGAFNKGIAGIYNIKGYLTLPNHIVSANDINAVVQLCIKYLTENYNVIHTPLYTHFMAGDLSGAVKMGAYEMYYNEEDGKYHIVLKGKEQETKLLTELEQNPSSQPRFLIKGDTNNNGVIDIMDAQKIIPYYLDGSEPKDPNEYLRADMNNDWIFDIIDAQKIINKR